GRRDQHLLDVARGTGLFAAMIKAQRPSLRITGVDVSPDTLELARRRLPSAPDNAVEWKQGFVESLPVESARFDVLTCTNAFHLVQDAPAASREFRRVLRPGGTLVLVDWCTDFPMMAIRRAVLQVVDHQKRSIRTLDQMAGLLADAGFQIQSSERFRAKATWGMMCIV